MSERLRELAYAAGGNISAREAVELRDRVGDLVSERDKYRAALEEIAKSMPLAGKAHAIASKALK